MNDLGQSLLSGWENRVRRSRYACVKWLLVLLMLAVVPPAAAGPNEEAFAAFVKGDYQTAVRITRPLAERGDAQAQASLGAMYEAGQGVPKDYAAAVSWMRQSAEQGNPNKAASGTCMQRAKGCRRTMCWRTCGTIWRQQRRTTAIARAIAMTSPIR